MNRFAYEKERRLRIGGPLFTGCFVAAVLLVFLSAFNGIGKDARQKEAENLRLALNRSVIIYYAMEGSYPESLEDIKERYGISWDENRYLVDFETVGSNLPPDIAILPKAGR